MKARDGVGRLARRVPRSEGGGGHTARGGVCRALVGWWGSAVRGWWRQHGRAWWGVTRA